MVPARFHGSPEHAARTIAAGRVLGVEAAPDGRMTVVILAGETLPVYVLCERHYDGWAIIDHDDELLANSTASSPPASAVSPMERTTWFSTVNDEAASNHGVEITRGTAPLDTVEALLRDGGEEYRAPVESGVYWYVRWAVPDPAVDDGIEVVAFRHVDGRILQRSGV